MGDLIKLAGSLFLLASLAYGAFSGAIWLYSGKWWDKSLASIFHFIPQTGAVGLDSLIAQFFMQSLGYALLWAGLTMLVFGIFFGWIEEHN